MKNCIHLVRAGTIFKDQNVAITKLLGCVGFISSVCITHSTCSYILIRYIRDKIYERERERERERVYCPILLSPGTWSYTSEHVQCERYYQTTALAGLFLVYEEVKRGNTQALT